MRAFIGIDFEEEMKNEIYEIQQKLKKYAKKGRWKYIDNYHITLKFLDEISLTQKKSIDDVMGRICSDKKPFDLSASKLGIFKGKSSIRVLWLGLTGDIQKLQLLYKEIDKAFTPIGFFPEKRKFRPHITIGQDIIFKYDFNQIRDSIGEINLDLIRVKSLYLIKSEQIKNKRIYSKVTEYKFSNF